MNEKKVHHKRRMFFFHLNGLVLVDRTVEVKSNEKGSPFDNYFINSLDQGYNVPSNVGNKTSVII